MYLKSLELSGFKSFADKTILDFGEGITAIVGPNGCGKTNITDAIKWVLGEQSAKSLRGTKMEDVIFNGTSKRKATSVSEITLTFDNSKNVLPLDYSQVTVTRRLFRTGESEYLLNKTAVRLKDIKDLFLDTGVGTESYSIMEQGKIDFILQSKPEERRYIFEEAAGVSKYKSKREEALKKLEKVGQDVLRLNDILLELESQKSKLDSQARKAKQYQKYLGEIKNYEINSLVKKYLNVKETNLAKLTELGVATENLSKTSLEIDKFDAKYSELKINLTAKEDELVVNRSEIDKIESSVLLLNERIRASEVAKADFISRNKEAEVDIEQGRLELDNYEKELCLVQNRLLEAEKVVSSTEEILAKKTEEKTRLISEITKINLDIENTRQIIFGLAAELSELHNRKVSSDVFLKEIVSRIERQNSQQHDTQCKKAEQEKMIEALQEKIKNINSDIEAKKNVVENLTTKINQCRIAVEKNQNEFLSRKEIVTQLSLRLETIIHNSNYELNCKIKEVFKGRVHGTVSDVIRVTDDGVSIVQSTLGEKSDYLIVDTRNSAIEVINWLKVNPAERSGWATFLIMSEIDGMTIPCSDVFSGKKIADFLDCEPKYKKIVDFLLCDATIKNENIHSDGLISGGVIKNHLRGGMEISVEVGRLKSEIGAVENEIDDLTAKAKNYQSEIATDELMLSTTKSSIDVAKDELLKITVELSTNEESLKASNNYLSILVAEYENLKKQSAEKESELALINEQISNKIEQEKSAKTKFIEQDICVKEFQTQRELLDSGLTNIQIDFSVKSSQMESIKEKIKMTSQSMQIALSKIEKSNKYLVDSAEKISTLDKTIDDSISEISKIVVSKDTLTDNLKNVEKDRNALKNEIIEVEGELRKLRIEQGNYQDEVRTIERVVSGTSSEIRQIESRIKEEKGILIDDAINNYSEITVSQDELEKMKKKIELLGAVNLAAPEEYEALEQRYNFLIKQKDDLEKAREDLHSAINKINLTTRQHFQETFALVRENFRGIFNKLFEGGEADLFLTDESNLLETGIDIIAQPPGKKLQHISLLSGGERSLTAIAILFAIYLVKPAPFCILDEIDGQLDEANVLRFTRMLKEFSETSQFFVITHNKRTMESANVLYGVTMEEQGVSKTISVHLEGQRKGEYGKKANNE